MLKHHLLLTFRNFNRFKNAFLINLAGLSTGLACTMLIFLWVNDELSIDSFHKKTDRLFQVREHQQYAEEIMTTTSTPGILAEALKDEIPEVEYSATTTWINNSTISVGEKNVKAEGFHGIPQVIDWVGISKLSTPDLLYFLVKDLQYALLRSFLTIR